MSISGDGRRESWYCTVHVAGDVIWTLRDCGLSDHKSEDAFLKAEGREIHKESWPLKVVILLRVSAFIHSFPYA